MENKNMAFGWVLLILGALYLLQDLSVIDFWTLNWYTAGFIVAGVYKILKK